jgi:hypothetical protein
VVVYGFAVFSGAFLLFQLQPIMGKYLLPWFGGVPAVWTTCLLVFQVLLLAGYGYAYLSTKWLQQRTQVLVHLALLVVALLLPVTPHISWKPATLDDPTWRICWLLASCLGLPFVVLSATAPLLQHWFSLAQTKTSPFRLYALSNAGSQLALLSYPVVFETIFSRTTQILLWRSGLAIFVLSCAWAGTRVWNAAPRPGPGIGPKEVPGSALGDRILWVLLPACGTLLLAAVTNKLCQDLAPIPLLWVLPLSVYLLSFILSFSGSRCYDRRLFAPLLFVSLVMMSLMLSGALVLSAQAQVMVFLAGFFVCCMVCHGEVFRLRPHPAHLASFYLLLGAGGALGGAFVAVIAPRIFNDYFELHWGLMLCGGLFLLACGREQRAILRGGWHGLAWGGGVTALCGLAVVLWGASHQNDQIRVYRSRTFYGVLNVYRHESGDAPGNLIELVHGRIAHGVQFLQPSRAQAPTLYYTAASGVGRAFALLPGEGTRRIGVVGLGAGTVAAFARPGDQIIFYEINPEVEKIAKTLFTFLRNCAGQVEIVPGDARLSLENEPAQDFDLLVLDAFNGDSIPIHLLTREAFATYKRQTRRNGVIAVHVSNRSLNLEPVLFNLAREFGYGAQVLQTRISNELEGILPSTWILLSQTPSFTEALAHEATARGPMLTSLNVPLWTDDYNGLFPVMRWWDVAAESAMPAPRYPEPGGALAKNAKVTLAIERFRKEIAADPNSSVALNNLACLLATTEDPALRDGPEAVRLAEKACVLTQYGNINALSTLAAAYAEAGRFQDAIAASEKACALASEKGETGLLAGNRRMLEYFRNRRPFHQGSP